MKEKCKELKISILISSISLILSICFKILDIRFNNNFTNFMENIILGIFCSSVITIFFYSSGYKVERKRLLERYWHEGRKLLKELNKIEYMHIEFEPNVMIHFIYEKSNLWIGKYFKSIDQEVPEKERINTELIKSKIREQNKELFKKLPEQAVEEYINKQIEKVYNETIERIDEIVEQYLNFLNYSTDNLNFMLGDMEFFTGKRNYIEAFKIFTSIYELRIKIQEEAQHFRYYKEAKGKGNKAVVLSKILELQKNIFRITENENSIIVYREFSDMMELKLEEFRANIIYEIEPEKIKTVPLVQIVKNTNNNKVKK